MPKVVANSIRRRWHGATFPYSRVRFTVPRDVRGDPLLYPLRQCDTHLYPHEPTGKHARKAVVSTGGVERLLWLSFSLRRHQ